MYPPAVSNDGQPMNDYVIHLSKDKLPPTQAFWSLPLYDMKNFFFNPNDQKNTVSVKRQECK